MGAQPADRRAAGGDCRHLERFTAADIEGLIKELYRQKHYEALSEDEILQAAASYQPTVTLDMRDRYEHEAAVQPPAGRPAAAEAGKTLYLGEHRRYGKREEALRNYVEKPLLYGEMCRSWRWLERDPAVWPSGQARRCLPRWRRLNDATFLTVNGPQLLSGRVGEARKSCEECFGGQEHAPAIIFFDEFDSSLSTLLSVTPPRSSISC
ncbi:MAG: AAA family ATPase [Merdibacter sp.]